MDKCAGCGGSVVAKTVKRNQSWLNIHDTQIDISFSGYDAVQLLKQALFIVFVKNGKMNSIELCMVTQGWEQFGCKGRWRCEWGVGIFIDIASAVALHPFVFFFFTTTKHHTTDWTVPLFHGWVQHRLNGLNSIWWMLLPVVVQWPSCKVTLLGHLLYGIK